MAWILLIIAGLLEAGWAVGLKYTDGFTRPIPTLLTVAGIAASWQGRVGGRTVIELNVRWKKAPTLEPDWQIQDGWVVEVQGRPTVRTNVQFLPPPDFQAKSLADFMVLGHIMTAMPAVNAIPAVVAAPPGIVSYADLPLPLPRGLVRP